MKRVKDIPRMTREGTDYFPCKTCSNILTKQCFDDCIYEGDFRHYHQRPGTDIKDLPPFPLQEVLNVYNAEDRLMAVGIYLTAITDFLQHMDDYAKNREYYKRNGSIPEDYSI